MMGMRKWWLASMIVAFVTFAGAFVSPEVAHAQTAVDGAVIELWNDTDGDGAYGGAGDTQLDIASSNSLGAFAIDAAGLCDNCGLVVRGFWSPGDDEIDSVGGSLTNNGVPLSAGSAVLWNDLDQDGVYGSAGDAKISSGSVASDGTYQLSGADCYTCAVVIVDWSPGDDEIDGIVGELLTWSPGDDEIDGLPGNSTTAWSPGGDDIDWSPGGDDIDWSPGGDDIDWSPGGDDIDWSPGGDDIDWSPGGDDIDWSPGGDDVD